MQKISCPQCSTNFAPPEMITGPLRCPACGHLFSLAELSRQSSSKVPRPSPIARPTVNLSSFPAESLSFQDNSEFNIPGSLSGAASLPGSGKETMDFGAYIAALEDLIPDNDKQKGQPPLQPLAGGYAAPESLLPEEPYTSPRSSQTHDTSPAPAPVYTPLAGAAPQRAPASTPAPARPTGPAASAVSMPAAPQTSTPSFSSMPSHGSLPSHSAMPSHPGLHNKGALPERATSVFTPINPDMALNNVGLFEDFDEDELPELPELPDLMEAQQEEEIPAVHKPEPEVVGHTSRPPTPSHVSRPPTPTPRPAPRSTPAPQPVFEEQRDFMSDDDFLGADFAEEPLSAEPMGRPTPHSSPSFSGGMNFQMPSSERPTPRVTQRAQVIPDSQPPEEFLEPQRPRRRPPGRRPAPGGTPVVEAPVFDDLLQEFMQSTTTDEVSKFHYKLKLNGKVFEHLKEEDILSLLETQQLTGEEEASPQLEENWKSLRDYSDFSPTISLLESEGKLASRTSLDAAQSLLEESPTLDVESISEEEAAALVSDPHPTVVDAQVPVAPPGFLGKFVTLNQQLGTVSLGPLKIPVLFLSTGVVILVLLALIPALMTEDKPRKVLPRKVVRRSINVLSDFRVTRSLKKSSFQDMQYALTELKKAGRDATFSSLRKIRAAYYLLDQFGNDPSTADEAERIANRLFKKLKNNKEKQRVKILQALTRTNPGVTKANLKEWKAVLPPNHEEWGYVWARALELGQQFGPAINQYKLLMKRYPNHLPAMLGYARLLLNNGQESKARGLYSQILKKEPRHLSALLTVLERGLENPSWKKLFPSAGKTVADLLRRKQTTSAATARWHYIVALSLWRQGQFGLALKKLNVAYTFDRNNRRIRIDRIRYNLWAGKNVFARRILKEELSNSSNNVYLKLLQIEVNIRLRQFRTATYQLNQHLRRARSNSLKIQLYFLQGQLYETRGYVKRAIRSYQASLQYIPRGSLYPAVKALFTLLLLQHQPQQVLETLRKVSRSYSNMRPYFRYIQARAYLQQNRLQEVQLVAESLRSRYPNWSRGFELQGRLLLQQNKPHGALEWFRRAIARQARNPLELRYLMASELLQQGNFADIALLHFRQQLEKQSQIPNTCYSMGLTAISYYAQEQCSSLRKLPLGSAYCAKPFLIRARCASRLSRTRSTLRNLKKAVRLEPRAVEPIWRLSMHYIQQKKWRQLRPASLVALRTHPRREQLVTRLLEAIPDKYSRQALKIANGWKSNGKFHLPLEQKILRLSIQNRGNRSVSRNLKKLLSKLASDEARAKFLVGLGRELVKRGIYKPAIPHYARALRLLPSQATWRLEAAELYERTGNRAYCQVELRTYLQSVPKAARPKARVQALQSRCKVR